MSAWLGATAALVSIGALAAAPTGAVSAAGNGRATAASAPGSAVVTSLGTPEQLRERGLELSAAASYDAALTAFEQAEALFRARGDLVEAARVQLDQAVVLGHSGAIARALARAEAAVALLSSLDLADPTIRERTGRAYLQLAGMRGANADPAGVEQAFAEAELLLAGDPLGEARIGLERSVHAARAGRHAEAVGAGRAAAAVFEASGQGSLAARALESVAYSLLELGHDDEVLAIYERLLPLAWQQNQQAVLRRLYCNRAEIDRRRGSVEQAESQLRRVVADLDVSWGASLASTPDERARAIAEHVAAYDRLIGLLVDERREDEAFAVAEGFRARAFLETLATGPNAIDDPRVATLRARLARLRVQPGLSAGERGEVERLEAELEEASVAAQRAARSKGPSRVHRPVSIGELQARLRPDEVAIAYWVGRERTFVWSVGRSATDLAIVPVTAAELRAAVESYLGPLRSSELARDAFLEGAEGDHLERGRELHRWLVGVLPAFVEQAAVWVVIPDDVLHYLPFEALVAGCEVAPKPPANEAVHSAYRGCRFVGLERRLVYDPSASAFVELRGRAERSAGRGSLLALAPSFGEPPAVQRGASSTALPAAAREIEDLRALRPDARFLVGAGASEAAFRTLAPGYRLLHLATHGIVDDRLPASSGVLLGAGAGADGYLQAGEVGELELDADLVVLSACRSGRGTLARGEGFVGLGRAFLQAGADRLVVALWDVEDQVSPVFMRAFYAALPEHSAPEALRLARRATFDHSAEGSLVFARRPTAWAHPRFWAPFVLVGAP